MTRLFTRSASLTVCFFLAACFLVSDDEISARIIDALPFNTPVQIVEIEKSLTCIAVTFSVLESVGNLEFSNERNQSTESDLGQTWDSNTSFSGYVETVEQGIQKSTVEGTVVHAKPCMDNVGFDKKRLYDSPVIVTRSKSGKEILFIFDQSEPAFGIYLAQGR